MEIFGPSLYAFIVVVSTLLGSLLTIYGSGWIREHYSQAISFSAGILLAVAFLRLIPECFSLANGNTSVYFFITAGFLAFYIIENLFLYHPCTDETCEIHKMNVLSVMGLSAHSFIDGIAITAVFAVNFELGIMFTLGVLFHKFSDGIVITSLLLAENSREKTLLLSFLTAFLTPVGTLVSAFFIRKVSYDFLASLIGMVSGMLIYLATADLIPQTHSAEKKLNILVLLSGVLFIIGVGVLFK